MSTRIVTYLGLDQSQYDAGLDTAEAKATGFAAKLNAMKVKVPGFGSARDSAQAIQEIESAEQSLAQFRQSADFERLTTSGKILALENEQLLAQERLGTMQGRTAERAQLQLSIEQRTLQIEQLRTSLARERAAVTGITTRNVQTQGAATQRLVSALRDSFGIANAVRSLFGALGLATIAKGAEMIASHFRDQAEAATATASAKERELNATERLIDLYRNDEQRISALDAKAASLTRQAQTANDEFNITGDESFLTQANELNAQIAEVNLERATLQKKLDDDVAANRAAKEKATTEELKRLNQQLADEKEKARDAELTDEQRLSIYRLNASFQAFKAAQANLSQVERMRALVEEQRLLNAAKEVELRIQQKTAAEQEKQASAAEDTARELRENAVALQRAIDRVAQARTALANAQTDRLTFSLADAANGRRGTGSDAARAARILKLEEEARRIFDFGGESRSQDGRRVITAAERAGNKLAEADALRADFTKLRADERDPFAKLKADLKSALEEAKTLTEIRDSLKPTDSTAPTT